MMLPSLRRLTSSFVTRRGLTSLTAAQVQLGSGIPTLSDRQVAARRQELLQNDQARSDLVYCLSFAANNDESFLMNLDEVMDDRMHQQIRISRNQLKPAKTVDSSPLPKTLEDALRPSNRAIVICEAEKPYRIWNVNRAWEDLCGYSYVESKGNTLGQLLHGPDTDVTGATNLIYQLIQNQQEVGTTLVNYRKDGSSFRNRIRCGPLVDASHRITHYVGVLQQV